LNLFDAATLGEMMQLTPLRGLPSTTTNPNGMNLVMNLGRAAALVWLDIYICTPFAAVVGDSNFIP